MISLQSFSNELEKIATIHVITGMSGAGKSTLREKLSPKYDATMTTDIGHFDDKGLWVRGTPEEREKIRAERLDKILKLHEEGKNVLVEGVPRGVMRLLGEEHLPKAKVFVLPISKKTALERVAKRAGERGSNVEEDIKSAKQFNSEYLASLKDISKIVPVTKIKGTISQLSDSAIHKVAKVMTNAQKADVHHSSSTKDWSEFEKNLPSKGFQKAVANHELSDSKIKQYVTNYGGYLSSKRVVATVPSRTGDHSYEIKKLPSGRLGCGCKDWQFKHSWKGTDCDHIQMISKKKVAYAVPVARALRGLQLTKRLAEEHEEGVQAKEYEKALRGGEEGQAKKTIRAIKQAIM